METTTSHTLQISRYLSERGSITPLEALYQFGCYRLGARIWDLRKTGMKIKTEMETKISVVSGKQVRYAKYLLEA